MRMFFVDIFSCDRAVTKNTFLLGKSPDVLFMLTRTFVLIPIIPVHDRILQLDKLKRHFPHLWHFTEQIIEDNINKIHPAL